MLDVKNTVENDLKEKICREIELVPEGQNRFQVLTPFRFDDGDYFAIVLKREGDDWILSDEGHTFMQLSYRMDIGGLDKGPRAKIISNTLSHYGMVEKEGALTIVLDTASAGTAFYDYLQGLTKITDVTYLSHDRVRSTFWDDFKGYIETYIPEDRIEFMYKDSIHDPEGMYPVDCRLNGMTKPLFIFAIGNDVKCKDVTINLHQYENWSLNFESVAIFEDQEQISRKALARFTDVSGKQFSSLYSNKDRIQKYLNEIIGSS